MAKRKKVCPTDAVDNEAADALVEQMLASEITVQDAILAVAAYCDARLENAQEDKDFDGNGQGQEKEAKIYEATSRGLRALACKAI